MGTSLGRSRRHLIVSLGLVAVTLAACGGGDDGAGSEATEPADAAAVENIDVTLQAQSYLSESAALGRVAAWFYDELESRTDGAVTVDAFWDGSLVEALGIRDAVSGGRLDIGQATHSYHPEAFPLTNITALPFETDNVPAQTAALTALYHDDEAFRAEWESQGIRLISFLAVPPSVLGSSEPIASLDQLQGQQVRGVDRFIPALEAIGANPVSLTAFELYESLERGVVSAYTGVPLDVVGSLGLHEVAPHLVDTGQGNYSGAYLAMSLQAWDSLPASVQETIDEIATELPELVGQYYAEGEDVACTAFADAGGSVTVLDDGERDRWAELIGDGIEGPWREAAEAAGADPDALLEAYRTGVAEAEGQFGDYENGLARCAETFG